MNKVNKKILRLAIILVLGTILINGCITEKKEETIKVGAILSLSGPASSIGDDVRKGMELAVDEINEYGGINGKKIELIVEDSKTNPEEGVSAFKKIEEEHHPDLYISTLSSVGMTLAPAAEENEVVLIGLVVTAPEFTQEKEWVFRYFPMANTQVPPTLSTLKQLNVKNLGIIYLDDPYGRSFFELAKSEFEKNGGTVKYESFATEDTDFKDKIAKLNDTEAIYVVGITSHIEIIIKQLREENFNGHILSTGAAGVPSVIAMPEADEVYVPALGFAKPGLIFAKNVEEKYENTYNKTFSPYSANGYDIIKLLGGLLEDKEVSRGNVKSLLEEGFVYPALLGDIVVKAGEHDIESPMYAAQIVDGNIKYL